MVAFRKRLIDKVSFEAAWACDVNGDGILDIVCGENWYEGPGFDIRHKICDIQPEGEYYDDFSNFTMDVDGDGRPDIITGGWWGQTLRWRKNPGGNRLWETVDIDGCGRIETTRFFDIDGCGLPEIFPNTPGEPQAFYKLVTAEGKGTGSFTKHVISEGASGHGLGFGDLNGDGYVDIILGGGWLENPGDPFAPASAWTFHPEFNLGPASIPILACDVNGDGLADLIVGNGHGYGLAWYEQQSQAGIRSWVKHDIDNSAAQYHDMVLFDIDGDGKDELVTGKRFRAHCGGDPGDNDPVGIYYFDINGGDFVKHVIDYGEAGTHSGVGIYFWIGDINGDGKPDIVAPGKEGLFLFEGI